MCSADVLVAFDAGGVALARKHVSALLGDTGGTLTVSGRPRQGVVKRFEADRTRIAGARDLW